MTGTWEEDDDARPHAASWKHLAGGLAPALEATGRGHQLIPWSLTRTAAGGNHVGVPHLSRRSPFCDSLVWRLILSLFLHLQPCRQLGSDPQAFM